MNAHMTPKLVFAPCIGALSMVCVDDDRRQIACLVENVLINAKRNIGGRAIEYQADHTADADERLGPDMGKYVKRS